METTEKEVWAVFDYGYYQGAAFKNVFVAPKNFGPGDSEYICDIRVYKRSEAEDMRIAKLIAAAPELLAALQAVRRHGLIEQDGYETVLRQVNEAIQKATL